jgi:hypothetical protein
VPVMVVVVVVVVVVLLLLLLLYLLICRAEAASGGGTVPRIAQHRLRRCGSIALKPCLPSVPCTHQSAHPLGAMMLMSPSICHTGWAPGCSSSSPIL